VAENDIVSTRDAFAREMTKLKSWLSQHLADSPQDAVGTIPPFYLAYTDENNRDLLALHGELSAQLMVQWAGTLGPIATGRIDRSRIEIGIVSAHICDHSVWNAILKGWVQHLDSQRFSLTFFHLGDVHDQETEFARTRASHFEHGKTSLEDWVRSIRYRQPDVLIYAEIGMDPLPLKLASLRLAPVQAATWGHPETTGLPTMDYYISAECLEPAGAEANYTESLVRLPGLGVCYEPLRIAPATPDLAALGIDRRRPMLISPGTPFKYSPRYDWIYASIAKKAPECQLIFFTGHKTELVEILRTRLQRMFRAEGIDIDSYVRFIPWLERPLFHGLIRHADVFLDPIGFSGFNTAIEAVEAGLPIVTRQGRYMRGRLASGILERMKSFELIARSEQEYINLAVKLASDADYRGSVRSRMSEERAILYGDIAPVRALEAFLDGAVAKAARSGVGGGIP
jgi:predicted O-linked N-acetylglucosamine transferase (SPINDLY family)